MERNEAVRARTQSFIVRVWSDDGTGDHIRGEIENVGTGERRGFLDYWSLRALIEAWRREPEQTA